MASSKPLIGVNLGGWLVLEPWMTPSLFAGTNAVDEYTFCRDADAVRRRKLKQFRDTFITRVDLEWLAQQGVQAVRLPIGYWLFGKQGPYVKTYQYVDMVFDWAEELGLHVLLSLHGAPGSQNGRMHSGQAGDIGWQDPSNIKATITILERIAKRYGTRPALLGISMLNEPHSTTPTNLLEDFYTQAVQAMQPHCPAHTWFVMSDNFKPHRWQRKLRNLPLDHHQYQVFRWFDKRLSPSLQILRAKYLLPVTLRRYARAHPLVIGEWSLVLRKRARTDQQTKQYAAAQLKAFKPAQAHFYWSYKTEHPGLWSFRHVIEKGLLTLKAPTK